MQARVAIAVADKVFGGLLRRSGRLRRGRKPELRAYRRSVPWRRAVDPVAQRICGLVGRWLCSGELRAGRNSSRFA